MLVRDQIFQEALLASHDLITWPGKFIRKGQGSLVWTPLWSLQVVHYVLWQGSVFTLSTFIKLQSGIKLHWLGVTCDELVSLPEKGGGVWKPLIRIFLYIFYNPVCRKDYMVIYSAYICLNRSYIFNVNAYLALHCFSFFNKWISKLS